MTRLTNQLRKLKTCVVGKAMGRLRERLLRTPVILGDPTRVHVDPTAECQDAILNARSGSIDIGARTFFGHGVMVLTGTHRIDVDPSERQKAVPPDGHDIHIGSDVWIGSGAILIGPLIIENGAVIGAGAVVRRNVAANTTVAGVPATPTKRKGDDRLSRSPTKSEPMGRSSGRC